MTMKPPFIITPRLMAGLRIGDAFVSIEHCGLTPDRSRQCYHYCIDTPSFEYEARDIHSGCQGGTLQEGMESLLSFLYACGEAMAYEEGTGRESENSDLFPRHVAEWARDNSDEISMLELELSENEGLIKE